MIVILLLNLATGAAPLLTGAAPFLPSSSGPSSSEENSIAEPEFQPKIAVVVGILAALLCLTFFLVVYGRHCKNISSRSRQSSATAPTGMIVEPNTIPHRHHHYYRHFPAMRLAYDSGGNLSQWILDALPKLKSSEAIFEGPLEKMELECPVCLSSFEDGDLLRLLPRCSHTFHLACVDKWLLSSPSCPVCRAGVCSQDIVDLENYFVHRSTAPPIKVENSPGDQVNDPAYIEVIVDSESGVGNGRFSTERHQQQQQQQGQQQQQLRRTASLSSLELNS